MLLFFLNASAATAWGGCLFGFYLLSYTFPSTLMFRKTSVRRLSFLDGPFAEPGRIIKCTSPSHKERALSFSANSFLNGVITAAIFASLSCTPPRGKKSPWRVRAVIWTTVLVLYCALDGVHIILARAQNANEPHARKGLPPGTLLTARW